MGKLKLKLEFTKPNSFANSRIDIKNVEDNQKNNEDGKDDL